jgi:putative SOS response-associated peptidase YedK
MCGRYTLEMDKGRLTGLFGLGEFDFDLLPRYNIAPSQAVVVVGLKPGGERRGLALLNWGLVPRWANDPNDGPRPINARAETLLEKPMFRESVRKRRCLLPATGFFEWKTVGKKKEPFLIRPHDGGVWAFAGLWDTWTDGARKLATCTIITVPSNDAVRPLHDRMPAIVPPTEFDRWLGTATAVEDALAILKPWPAEWTTVLPVGPMVNSVKNESPECITPITAPASLFESPL